MAALSCCLRSELLCARAACLFSIKFQVASDKYACFCSVGILVRSFSAAWLIACEKFLLFICTLSRDEQKSKFARMSSLNHIFACSLGFLNLAVFRRFEPSFFPSLIRMFVVKTAWPVSKAISGLLSISTIAFFQRFGHKMWSSWANLSGVHGAAKPSVSENLNVHCFCGGFEKYVLVISCNDVIVIYKNQ